MWREGVLGVMRMPASSFTQLRPHRGRGDCGLCVSGERGTKRRCQSLRAAGSYLMLFTVCTCTAGRFAVGGGGEETGLQAVSACGAWFSRLTRCVTSAARV